MSTQLPHVTLSYRGSSSRSSPLKGQLRLHRGAYVQLPFDPSSAKPWDIWKSIAMARIIASVQQGDPMPLVVGTSALLLHGVQGWIANPNVELYQPQRRTSQLIPPFRCAAKPVPAVRRVYRRGPPITSERARVSGILTEHPYDALIRCAMHDDALQAFVLGCGALHKWSGFSNFSQDACRGRAEDIRKEILSRLERAKGRRGYARAQRILSTIDPGCSNPAEAALAWVVRSLCPYDFSTQCELSAGGRPLFADIAIPRRKLIIEFDGIEKLGSTQGEFDRAKRSWVQREQALQDQGWRFLRVNWLDFNDWSELRRRINSAIGVASKPIPARYALLWEPPSERCDGEGRRFRGHEWHESDESWT
ncbi:MULTISPECIES: endonuclease domain-containing protein [Actinomyces]|uniref:endonuclease domain-containing protein n=1 Tax=Actinomyces TaxID=1654 RepID=UPI000B2E20DD|nr:MULTISPECIES: endonuclease domain-containing protein [Actinomyces]